MTSNESNNPTISTFKLKNFSPIFTTSGEKNDFENDHGRQHAGIFFL